MKYRREIASPHEAPFNDLQRSHALQRIFEKRTDYEMIAVSPVRRAKHHKG